MNSLLPAYTNIELSGTMTGTIFEGRLTPLKGKSINLYYGYRLNGAPLNDIHYNSNLPTTFKVD